MIRIFRQCEFGCGTKIYVDPVPFYDGLKLYIRREEAVPRIHNCPKLWTDPGCFEENEPFQPDDPPPVGVDCYPWSGYDLNEHFAGLDGDFGDCSGMEYYHARHRLKQILIESLNSVPGFAIEVNVSSPYDLPYDFQIESSSFGQFLPLELLGMFYEMDGKL